MRILAPLIIILGGVALAIWLAFAIVSGIWGALKTSFNETSKNIDASRKRREEEKKQAAIEKEKTQIEDFRVAHPVQIIGVPNLALLNQISEQLDQFIDMVKFYRPPIPPYDARFRSVNFSYPFEFFLPRKNSNDDGPDPEPWETTLDALTIKSGRPARSIYEGLSGASEFPAKEPSLFFEVKPPLRLPKLQLPPWSIKIVEKDGGHEISFHSDFAAKAYAAEIEQAGALRRTAVDLQAQITKK